MLPETPFHKFGKENLMFVIFNNTIYHTENAGMPNENYLSFFGLFFPLKKSETIQNIETRYIKRNSDVFEEFKRNYLATLRAGDDFVKNLDREIKNNKSLYFFITKIIPSYIEEKIREESKEAKNDEAILEEIVHGNVAVLNKRVYSLAEIDISSVVRISGRHFWIKKSEKTIDRLEEEFQNRLEEKLKKEAIKEMNGAEEIKNKLISLEGFVRDLVVRRHLNSDGNFYEYGDVGYDSKLNKIYHLLPPHFNKTKLKHYGEGQAAIAVDINEGNLTLTNKSVVLFRKNRESDFSVDESYLCLGFGINGNSTEKVVSFLKKASVNIGVNKRFHT